MLDNWIVDVVIGNWFDRPIERYLEPSNRPVAGPRPGISLAAAGNRIDPPAAE